MVAIADGVCFGARIDLTHVSHGLTDVRIGQTKLPGASLMAVVGQPPWQHRSPEEIYVRRGQLNARYGQIPPRPVTGEIAWRVRPPEAGEVAAVALAVGVQTSLMDDTAKLLIRSVFPAGGVWQLADLDGSKFDQLTLAAQLRCSIGCPEHMLLVLRPPGDEISCAVFASSADVDSVTVKSMDRGRLVLRVVLFGEHLEKGVVRQTHLEHVWLMRHGDLDAAVNCYRRWLRSGSLHAT